MQTTNFLLSLALGLFTGIHARPQNWSQMECPTCFHPVGCYHGGLPFNGLHGDSRQNLHQEVVNDINRFCLGAQGVVLKPTEKFSDCSEWAKSSGGTNRIEWYILNIGGGADDRAATWEECNAALNRELGGCSSGSEQKHGEFRYRIDPQKGA